TDREKLLRALKVAQGFEAERDFALVQFLLLTGARIGSTLVLDIEDLDLAAGEATLKCKADRTERLFLNAEVVGHLRTWIGRRTTGPVFTTRNGRRLTSRQFARRLGQWSTQAGIQRSVSPHCLRHSFAMRVLEKTGDLLLTQAALGHRSIASTMAYVRVDPARLRRALA
ncbi:MAG: tyrosine-type recombinase/integrase, partial [Planctomycetes bacterium]|nr:tyrosine-type recombinase/integrase [Planctomycetota bacterium]